MINICKNCTNNQGNMCIAHGEPEQLPLGYCNSCDCFKCDNPYEEASEWINVDETLPTFTGLYLVSIDALVTVANFTGAQFLTRGGVRIEVDAWQPLPAPYQKDGEL